MYDQNEVIGKSEADAKSYLESVRMVMRVSERDGVSLPGIANMQSNRINVAVQRGSVTRILSVG